MEEQRQRQEDEARRAREASGAETDVKTETIKEGKLLSDLLMLCFALHISLSLYGSIFLSMIKTT